MARQYQFGKFVLNVQEQLLTADGRPVHLPTKEFETLQMLVENNGKVLSKDEMMSAIWKDTFVEESNLAQYVSRLRKVLNVDGNQYIKTISKRGYRFSADVKIADADVVIERHMRVKVGGGETRSLSEINSVAVLPFQSLAAPADDDFLGVGIADALITQLTRTGQIVTRPTASVLKFRTGDQDAAEIAQMLDVDAILQGNFQRAGNRLRLTAQMLDSATGKTLWAESFNTDIDDIFDVQDSIAKRIVSSFSKEYSGDQRSELTKHYTENREAYQEYLQGRSNYSKRTGEGLRTALRNFERAIEIDPFYALAYAGMAEVYQLLPLADEMEPHAAFPKAKAAVLRALEIDDAIPEAHVSLGVILMDFDWNWRGAELSFQRAIELNPNYPAAHQVYGTFLLRLGRIGDAILELKKAQQLDPLSPAINTWMAEAFAYLGEHEAAIRILKETIRLAPDYLFAHYFLVLSYLNTDQLEEAQDAAVAALRHSDDMSLTRSASVLLKVQTGDRDGAREEVRELIEKRNRTYVSAINIASGFAALHETEDAFKWLEVACDERDSNLTWLNVDREFDYLREDRRFGEILKKVNLPEAADPRKAFLSDAATGKKDPLIPAPTKGRWIKFAIVGVIVVAALAATAYFLTPSLRTSKAAVKNTLIRLTNEQVRQGNPMFTADGQVRYLRFADKKVAVSYIMNADGTNARPDDSISGLGSGIWSPDGSRVFFHKASGDPNLYLANSDGSNERQMTFRPGNAAWSRDSKRFIFQSNAYDRSLPNNSDIFIYDLESDSITPIVQSPFFDSDPSFSPDGKSIVYASDVEGNFEIYSRVIATGETKRLTNNPGHESFPSYSPDGTQISFNSDGEKENNDVYLMNADGSGVRKITDGPGWDAVPANGWSADGTQVLLLSDEGGHENIYVMNIEPSTPRRVAVNVESDQSFTVAYSPDGQRIVYQTSNEIRLFDNASKTDKRVFETSAGGGASFSPDGGKIVFQDRIEDNTEICSVNIDGSGFTNLTQHASRDMGPSYSPDGSKIVFAANRALGTSTFEIYVMNADGSDPRMVFGDRAMSSSPVWSPDGKSVLFSNDREDGRVGNFELFVIDVDGGTPRRLTNRPKYDVDGVFSPDGGRIAFISNADGNFEIYMMNADGSGLVRLTRDVGNDFSPRWSPDGKRIIFTSDRSGKYAIYEIEV